MNCVLLAEVPMITAVYGNVYLDPHFSSPFSPNSECNSTDPDKEIVTNMNKFISTDAKSAFTSCHKVLHTPAKELLVFMLTNKDRKQNKHVPYSYPVAYALKGSSMSNCDLHFMVNKLHNELKKRNIHVLCEAYDGQWHNHIVLGSNGQHLTKMHAKITWQCISKLSKDKCLEQLSAHSIIKNTEKNAIQQLVLGFNEFTQDNVHVQQNNCGAISIMTISKKMGEIVSVIEKSWPDLFHEGISMFAGNTNNRNRLKKNLGLQENEQDILSLINSDINNENLTNLEDEDDTLPDLNPRGDECSLLQNILNQLQNFNATKWQDKSKHFLYPHLLTDTNKMMKFCIVKELNIIATEMRCITGRIWFSNGAIKSENVNLIVSTFGGVCFPNQEISRHKRKLYQPDSLVLITSQALRNENFPIEHLQIPLATLIQRENTRKWKENATCNLFAPIPSENDPRIIKPLEYFSYPEFCPV